jgi:hypothetical protein
VFATQDIPQHERAAPVNSTGGKRRSELHSIEHAGRSG